MRRIASAWSEYATKSVIKEINALVELLKSPIIHADRCLFGDRNETNSGDGTQSRNQRPSFTG